jgi:hypothetical protein
MGKAAFLSVVAGSAFELMSTSVLLLGIDSVLSNALSRREAIRRTGS